MNISQLIASLQDLTEANRAIRLRLATAQGVADDVLLVKHVSGIESICGGIDYRLLCVSTRAGLPLKQFNAAPVEVQFVTDTGNLRSVCGIVSEVTEGESDGGLATYQLRVRDALALMEKRVTTRVFRYASEIDITSTILREWHHINPILARVFDFELLGSKSYPSREFTMQYNESDASFLRRLWKRRGLSWFFQPGTASDVGSKNMPGHTLVVFDDSGILKQNAAGTVRYHRDDGTETRDSITAWNAFRTLNAGSVTRQSWDYAQTQPLVSEEMGRNNQGPFGNQFATSLDDYLIDVPHAGNDRADYQSLCTLRMQRHELESKCFHGESSVRDLCVGQWIGVTGHAEIDTHPQDEREFVVTELRVDAENNLPKTLSDRVHRLFARNQWPNSGTEGLAQASAERGARYTNRFSCVRRTIPIVPAYDPRVDLPCTEAQSVIVVGPVGEEVHCDEHGRVKVRFPACRPADHEHAQGAGASDTDTDSAWVRVASSWASSQWGAIALPRAGDECIVTFLGGDPDKPIITGRVYGGMAPPPSFSHVGSLPGNRFVSGIKSKEINGRRYNQLRLDDTPGQISAQLASEHGNSQLNLGYLTHPRKEGKGEQRGDGAELRTDGAVAVRGGKGVYISADARLRATGRQLERDGLTGLSEALKGIQQQLSELAETHYADKADDKPLAQLAVNLKEWDDANAGAGKSGALSGHPIVAINAPAGMILGSGDNIAVGAQSHVDIVSVGNTQVSTGRKLLLRATESISLFAHKLGMKLIAASGKVEIQAHQDNIELTAARRIVLAASEEIVLQAPKVTIITQGAQAAFGGGAVSYQLSGAYTINSATFAHKPAGDSSPAALKLPTSEAAHDQRVRITDLNTGEPLANQRFRATLEDGQEIQGTTDAEGLTQILKSSIPFGRFAIEAIDD